MEFLVPKILNLNAERNSSLGNPTWDPLTIHLMILLYKYQKKKVFLSCITPILGGRWWEVRQFALGVSTIHLETEAQKSYDHLSPAILKCQPCGRLIGVPAINGRSTSTFISFRVLYSLYILCKLLDLTRRSCWRQTTGKGLCWVEFGTNLSYLTALVQDCGWAIGPVSLLSQQRRP